MKCLIYDEIVGDLLETLTNVLAKEKWSFEIYSFLFCSLLYSLITVS